MSINVRVNRKGYSNSEESFLRECVKIGIEKGIPNSHMARTVAPLLERSPKGVELKLSFLKQDLYPQNKKENLENNTNNIRSTQINTPNIHKTVNPTRFTEEHRVHNFNVSSIQTIETPYAQRGHEPLTSEFLNQVVKVKVYNVKSYGAFCQTEEGKTALLLIGMITTDHVENVSDYLQVGDVFNALVVPDKQREGKVLLNAKAVGNIVAIKDRKRMNN